TKGYTMLTLEKYTKEIIELYNSGKTSREIAKKFNKDMGCVLRILKKNGIKRKTNEDRRIFDINKGFFKEINSFEKASILGFMFADGCNYNLKFRIGIHKKDIDYLWKINKLIQTNKPNPIRFTYNGGFSHTNRQDKDIAYLTLYCKEI